MHLHVDPDLTIRVAHDLGGKVKATLRQSIPNLHSVLIHIEPAERVPSQSVPSLHEGLLSLDTLANSITLGHTHTLNFDAHGIERTPDEDLSDDEENSGDRHCLTDADLTIHRYGQFHGQQSEQRRKLDDRIHGHRRGIFERIAHRIADDRCIVKRCSLGLQFCFDQLLSVIQAPPALAMKIA